LRNGGVVRGRSRSLLGSDALGRRNRLAPDRRGGALSRAGAHGNANITVGPGGWWISRNAGCRSRLDRMAGGDARKRVCRRVVPGVWSGLAPADQTDGRGFRLGPASGIAGILKNRSGTADVTGNRHT